MGKCNCRHWGDVIVAGHHKTKISFISQQTGQVVNADCYYLRVWIQNHGTQRAEQVQVFAARLFRRHADGSFKAMTQFLPMNLRWAHSQQSPKGPEIFAEGISPGMGKHCDLGHIVDPKFASQMGKSLPNVASDQVILALDLEVAPNTLSHLVPPGTYRLELKLAAANSRPVVKTVEITLTGKWFSDEAKMFSDGLGLRDVSGG